MRRRAGAPIWVGLGATVVVAAVQLTAVRSGRVPLAVGVSDVLAVCAFTWCGVLVWRRRAASLTGPLLILAGLGLTPVNLIFVEDPLLRTIGLMGVQTFAAPLAHLLLAFPSGRVGLRRLRVVVAFGYLHVTVQWWLFLTFYEAPAGCASCLSANLLGVFADRDVWEVLWRLQAVVSILFGLVVLAIIFRRYKRSTAAGRRVFAPVLLAGTTVAIIAIVTTPFAYAMLDGDIATTPLQALWSFAWWVLPLSVVTAVSRTRASHLNLGELVERLHGRLPPLGLRDALADALGDPTLELGFWVPELGDWRDVHGRPLRSHRDHWRPRAVTELRRGEARNAVLVHDPALLEDTEALEAVRAAATVALDRERLHSELAARLAEVRAAQARQITAADETRRRIERELRAGPQRALLDLGATLAMVTAAVPRERREDLEPLVAAAGDLVTRARDELRDLAAGVYPEALTRGGLDEALRDLAHLSPLPVELRLHVPPDLPQPVAVAAWFACREAIANAAKHAGARRIDVVARELGGLLLVEVSDDGAGGADASGSGLRGLADRVEALGGELHVLSPAGEGTRVRVVLPLEVPA